MKHALSDISAKADGNRRPLTSGRPPSTSRRQLALVAMRLFSEQGFEQTTVDQIAAAAGVSRRTFFRYFATKSAVLWNDFDREVQTITRLLAQAPPEQPMMQAIRDVVVAANHYQ
jgi:TetR/AcrR family transcriptional regulator, regulator of mycofactocin system